MASSSKQQIFYLNQEEDINKIHALLNDESELNEILLSSDDEDADPNFCEVSDHDSESEEEYQPDETETNLQTEEENEFDRNIYIGKNKTTKWRKENPPSGVRTRRHNIVTHLPGVIGVAKAAKSEFDCWSLFLTPGMLKKIENNTNIYIDMQKNNYTNLRKVKPVDQAEIKCVLGLLYLAGVHKEGRTNIEDLWDDDGTGMDLFIASMSLQRFRFIVRMLRFDDKATRRDRSSKDNLAPIREIFEEFVGNCRSSYSIGEYATLDEMLPAFRGRCPFRVYMPNKPSKYGIKIYAVVDSRMNYALNLEVYTGKQPSVEFYLSNKPDDVVERLCRPIYNTGRNVTFDNWFSSYPISQKMLSQYNLTVVGTLKKNKRELPAEFSVPKKRPVHSSLFGFQESATIVSYIPKKYRVVNVISTMHNDKNVDEESGEKCKPEIITFYNTTKGGVDVVDKLCSAYDVSRNSRRWPLTIFFTLMNIASVNSHIIYKNNNNSLQERRLFIKNLAKSLILDNLKVRAENLYLKKSIRALAQKYSGSTVPKLQPPEPNKRGRCSYCKDTKSKYYCSVCNVFICLKHAAMICPDCNKDN